MRVLDMEYAHRLRPAMYDEPVCAQPNCCTHSPHEDECDVCKTEEEYRAEQARTVPRNYKGEAQY